MIAMLNMPTYPCTTSCNSSSPHAVVLITQATTWDANTPFEILIDQVEEYMEFPDASNQLFTAAQILNIVYTLVFQTGHFFDECNTWNTKPENTKTCENFKAHFLNAQNTLYLQ